MRTALGADGVLLATIDMAERTMNVFSAGLMDALDRLMDRVDTDAAVKSSVITSGKPSFLAGALDTAVAAFLRGINRMNTAPAFVATTGLSS